MINDVFWHTIGLNFLKEFQLRHPEILIINFETFNKELVEEIALSVNEFKILKEPFKYVNGGLTSILVEFQIYKKCKPEEFKCNISELIQFAETLLVSN